MHCEQALSQPYSALTGMRINDLPLCAVPVNLSYGDFARINAKHFFLEHDFSIYDNRPIVKLYEMMAKATASNSV